MTRAKSLLDTIQKNHIHFISGVPDSKLKDDLNNLPDIKHVLAVDEGEAAAIAVGHYIATKEVPLVYMQSDGVCNALNAITSLVIPYKIPMHIFVSIRTKPIQHEIMGRLVRPIITRLEKEDININFHIYD